jgi:hypothetical protein
MPATETPAPFVDTIESTRTFEAAIEHLVEAPLKWPNGSAHTQRGALTLRLLPDRGADVSRHLVVGVRNRLERTILSVGAAGLERHDIGLPGRVHHCVRDLV